MHRYYIGGGAWFDSTLLVIEPIDKSLFEYPIYTRNLPETQYCTNAMWADWFLFAEAGYVLFQFLMEGFFAYYKIYDKIKYYFTVDYIIALACNYFEKVEKQLKEIPYNNESALNLSRHLKEKYDKKMFEKFIEGSSVQKLTYKIQWNNEKKESSIYNYILEIYLRK